MARSPRTLLLRFLSRLLAPGKGEVRALEEALHLEGVVRFFALFLITVVLPALLLGYLGIRSLRAEELDVEAEARRTAEVAAGAFWEGLDREMSGFEDAVRTRLEAGRSTLESPKELHPDVVVALRFDRDLRLEAPFSAEAERGVEGPMPLGMADWRAADRLARSEGTPPAEAADAFRAVAERAVLPQVEARARFDHARMLARAGRTPQAVAAFSQVVERWGQARDPWGFRYVDLVALEVAELRLEEDRDAGATALRDIVDRLLAERWTLGFGAEGAVARRALSLAEPWLEPDWVAGARGRVARRTAMHFWAEQLLPELDPADARAEAEGIAPGAIRWRTGDRALWATTRWEDGLYAFAFDMDTLTSRLKADARATVAADSPVIAFLLSPEDGEPSGVLERRSLSPYLSGWAVAVTLEDPESIAQGQAFRRALRFGTVALSVGMISLGFMFSLRMIGRELDVARMKADFAASVSHELRSPITQIRLKGESLMLGLADTDEERDDHYQAIVRESERLSRLVDNVLDFAAIERGAKSYTLRPGDLSQTVHRALLSMESSLEFRDMHLDVALPDDLPAVHHDADAVAQCVINLVSNAAKYSPEGETIHVTARVVEGELPGGYKGSIVEAAVSDHGIGIAAHDLRSIFEPFYRSRDSLARRRKGTGIGLTITRYIMEAHGGTVSVQSKPGHGSTFTLRFPLEPPAEARRASSRTPTSGRGRTSPGA